jgi:exodeoxyribonuclease VII small subunit
VGTQELTFEQAYKLLEETVGRLEEGNANLEESVALFEQGMQLVARCNELLGAAELRVSQLVPSNGEYQTAEF